MDDATDSAKDSNVEQCHGDDAGVLQMKTFALYKEVINVKCDLHLRLSFLFRKYDRRNTKHDQILLYNFS